MLLRLLLAIPVAVVWLGITSRISLENALLGYLLGLGLSSLLQLNNWKISWRRLPSQLIALVTYVIWLYRDILVSSFDVAFKVLKPRIPLKTGIVAISTEDERKSGLIAALSADYITLTPGELVVEIEDNSILYIHALDIDTCIAEASITQRQRLTLLQRILGTKS